MSTNITSAIISLSFAIILLPALIIIFRLKKNETSIIFIALAAFFGSKLVLANRISLFKESSWINNVNDDVLLALVILGVYITSSFMRFIYHYLNVYTKKRKISFWLAAGLSATGAIVLIITHFSNTASGLYALVVASFAYGCVESLTGMLNVVFSERRKLPWVAVPIMVTTPAIATLLAKPVHSLLFEAGLTSDYMVVTISFISLIAFGLFAFLIYKMVDVDFVPYKYLSTDPTTARKMLFQFWFAFLSAITLSFFSTSINSLVFSEWNYPKLEYFMNYLTILMLVMGIIGSSFITRYLLERYNMKMVILIGCGLVITTLIAFAITESLDISSPLTGFLILPFFSVGINIVYTIVFTKSVEGQLFSNINVTKYFLSIKAIGYVIGGLIAYLLISTNTTSIGQKSYFWSLIILIALWTISFIGVKLRYQKHYPDATNIQNMIIEKNKL